MDIVASCSLRLGAPSLGADDRVLDRDSCLDKILGLGEVERLVDPPSDVCLETPDRSFDGGPAWVRFVEIEGCGVFERRLDWPTTNGPSSSAKNRCIDAI